MPSRRQLVAIMFTDIVGYTAMMQHNEQQAVSTAKRYQELLEAFVLQYKGEVLNDYGDGSLGNLARALDAFKSSF